MERLLGMALAVPMAIWEWWTVDRFDRDIEAQRRDLERLAAETAGKIETTDRSL